MPAHLREPTRMIAQRSILRRRYCIPTDIRFGFERDASTIFEVVFAPASLQASLQRAESAWIRRDATDVFPHGQWLYECAGWVEGSYTIFEGTSEIQRLVIARSISGLHIR